MEIYLSKPGGQREGPYTLDQINHALAAKKYGDTDYWAWYEGLEAWVPLYSIPGITEHAETPAPKAPAEEQMIPAEVQAVAVAGSAATATASRTAVADPPQKPAAPKKSAASGLPFDALEQIFIFTSGEGPSATQSSITAAMLEEIVGADFQTIRARVPRDVFGRCNIAERLRRDGKVPSSAWRAMSALKPTVVREAQEGNYRACVRTFVTETGDTLAVFLFYNKQKL
jgi:hypothetical protein